MHSPVSFQKALDKVPHERRLHSHVQQAAGETCRSSGMFPSYDNLVDFEPQCLKNGAFRTRLTPSSRRKREFMPDEKKDASYWEKRRKNNEAAKRSREKRRLNDLVLESQVLALNEENTCLRRELLALKMRYSLISASAYAQEAQIIQGCMQKCYSRHKVLEMDPHYVELNNSFLRNGCCVVTPHSPRLSVSPTAEASDQPANGERRPHSAVGSPHEPKAQHNSISHLVYPKYLHPFHEKYPDSSAWLDTRPSLASPKAAEVDGKNSKRESEEEEEEDEEGEDEHQVPNMQRGSPTTDLRLQYPTAHKPNHSALPHKLRIKTKANGAKSDSEFDVLDKDTAHLGNTRCASLTEIRNGDVSVCGSLCHYKTAFKPVLPIYHSD
eukprot:gi/632966279/ref/XP_007899326.1/ PREDICTED: nuclear factor interleukin-3-regulated protein-like [Callorhinchus milii]